MWFDEYFHDVNAYNPLHINSLAHLLKATICVNWFLGSALLSSVLCFLNTGIFQLNKITVRKYNHLALSDGILLLLKMNSFKKKKKSKTRERTRRMWGLCRTLQDAKGLIIWIRNGIWGSANGATEALKCVYPQTSVCGSSSTDVQNGIEYDFRPWLMRRQGEVIETREYGIRLKYHIYTCTHNVWIRDVEKNGLFIDKQEL